ncbi:cysteine desulfurase [Teredinibacter sp. KSP-S5-2]|uniref:aminotransferase class V-fold PLP-dependent enzyme n=1 Tax=Teredinibacter sp. KSP-S5-2 TaxID=3034506 RepID=UPI002934AE9D|nr:cysteine desulfurase [Teredinibacter sp. KSP-S5-2]WNO11185.1 cysteine desulfurase [Teredinibacter sp. KSP-S5-2]
MTKTVFDVLKIREDFPILKRVVNGMPLVYLDNAATTQKPQHVIDAICHYYTHMNSNVHRGAHTLSNEATEAFEAARRAVQDYIHAESSDQVLWVRGTTEGLNLIASSYGGMVLEAGDKVLVSAMEHHSNIVPWQMVAQQKGANVEPIPVDAEGTIDLDAFKSLLDEQVKIVSVGHVSNALGTINPIEEIIALAHKVGAKVVVDGAQSVGHWNIDVQKLNCDFYVFSAHKMFGPTGIGAVYGKRELLESMPPYQGGGEMIEQVSFAGTTYNQLPYKFEAGTPNIADAIGFAAAIEYLNGLDRKAAAEHEAELLNYAVSLGEKLDGFNLIGRAKNKTGVLSFLLEGTHPSDVGMILDQKGIAVRTGHHCAQPIMDQYKIPGTIRASFSFYNTKQEIDALFAGLETAKMFLL